MEEDESTITDNVAEGRWELAIGTATAALSYSRGPSVLALLTTEIPDELGGAGIASRLARHAMEVARGEGLKIDPQCPFMIGWLDRHPEYGDLVYRTGGPTAGEPFWF